MITVCHTPILPPMPPGYPPFKEAHILKLRNNIILFCDFLVKEQLHFDRHCFYIFDILVIDPE